MIGLVLWNRKSEAIGAAFSRATGARRAIVAACFIFANVFVHLGHHPGHQDGSPIGVESSSDILFEISCFEFFIGVESISRIASVPICADDNLSFSDPPVWNPSNDQVLQAFV